MKIFIENTPAHPSPPPPAHRCFFLRKSNFQQFFLCEEGAGGKDSKEIGFIIRLNKKLKGIYKKLI